MSWRENVDPIIKSYLELQVKDTQQFKGAYSKAKEPSKAQLWIAIANLSKHIFSLEMKIKYLEKTLQEIAMKFDQSKTEDFVKNLEESIKKSKTKKKAIKKRKK
jgi:predicted ATP-dependent endonuclease of OLD family